MGTTALKPRPTNSGVADVRLNRDGDVAALYDAYGALVFLIARRVTGRSEDAEEICQDVFVKFWHGDGYDPTRGSVKTWLAMNARCRAIERVRREFAQKRCATGGMNEQIHDPIDDHLRQDHAASEVRRALAALSPIQLESITLAYFGGLTQPQIAVQMNLPLGTVKSHVSRALKLLRRAQATRA